MFAAGRGMALTDVNQDGDQDILLTNSTQILEVEGNGDGTFAGAHRFLFARAFMVMADFDGHRVELTAKTA